MDFGVPGYQLFQFDSFPKIESQLGIKYDHGSLQRENICNFKLKYTYIQSLLFTERGSPGGSKIEQMASSSKLSAFLISRQCSLHFQLLCTILSYCPRTLPTLWSLTYLTISTLVRFPCQRLRSIDSWRQLLASSFMD